MTSVSDCQFRFHVVKFLVMQDPSLKVELHFSDIAESEEDALCGPSYRKIASWIFWKLLEHSKSTTFPLRISSIHYDCPEPCLIDVPNFQQYGRIRSDPDCLELVSSRQCHFSNVIYSKLEDPYHS